MTYIQSPTCYLPTVPIFPLLPHLRLCNQMDRNNVLLLQTVWQQKEANMVHVIFLQMLQPQKYRNTEKAILTRSTQNSAQVYSIKFTPRQVFLGLHSETCSFVNMCGVHFITETSEVVV